MGTSEKEFYRAFLIVVFIVIPILVVFLLLIIRQQRSFRLLAKAKITAEINTLEKERKRIASDLHDEVGPLLSAVKLQINHLDLLDDQQKILVDKSSLYIDDVIKKMREISNDLLPSILVRRGLGAAIEDFLSKIRPGVSMQIETDIQLPQRLPQGMEVNLYRIVQEVTHNTVKHAKASRYRLEISREANLVRLATADNGVGISEAVKNRPESGHGLLNLQSRTEVMGGEFFCKTAPGKGTQYLFEIPVENDKA